MLNHVNTNNEKWLPYDTAPPYGSILVYIPTDITKYHVEVRHPKLNTIGNRFDFDMDTPTLWSPLYGCDGKPLHFFEFHEDN